MWRDTFLPKSCFIFSLYLYFLQFENICSPCLKFLQSKQTQYVVISKSNWRNWNSVSQQEMVPLTKTSNWHFEEENNCAKSLFFSFVRKVVLSLFQSILKLFKVHKVFTPFLTYCDTWNFATFFNIYSTLQYSFITKPFYSVQMEVQFVISNPIIFYYLFSLPWKLHFKQFSEWIFLFKMCFEAALGWAQYINGKLYSCSFQF